jgi:hypothetical protein
LPWFANYAVAGRKFEQVVIYFAGDEKLAERAVKSPSAAD